MNLICFWDRLEDPSRVNINVAPNDVIDVDMLGEGNEEVNIVGTSKTVEDELGVEPSHEEHEDLAWLEGCIMDIEKMTSLQELFIIGTSGIHKIEPKRPLIDLESHHHHHNNTSLDQRDSNTHSFILY